MSQKLICCLLEVICFAEYSPERMELILQNPSLPLLFPLSTQNMGHKEMSCTLHSTTAMSAFTYPHICLPHIFHGQGQCPGKSSHSSDSSPGGRNQVWELDMNLMIFTAHTHVELLLMCEQPTKAVVESVGHPRWVDAIS